MSVAVKMPQLGETVIEGTVSRWLKAEGDAIARLEPLLEIATDKIDTEVPAPADGTLLQILVAEGQTVRAGEIIAYIGSPHEATVGSTAGSTDATGSTPESTTKSARKARHEPDSSPVSSPHAAPLREATPSATQSSRPLHKPAGRDFISPVVANMAREHALDLEHLQGSGMGGRITKQDVVDHLARQVAPPVTARQTVLELQTDEVWEPLSAMRRIIADHMVASKRTSPHVTSIFEVDMTQVVRHREAHKAAYAQKGTRLTFTPYFVATAATALRHVPQLNARFHEQDGQHGIIRAQRIHIGVAVAVEGGLVVPVIRDADERNLAGLARAVGELAQAAHSRQLAPDAAIGGTFTITNHGTGGSLLGTPIINQPQAAILGVGAITKRPVVRSASASLLPSADDAIVIRPMCYLSLTFDHRLIDGATADAFLTTIQRLLEDWQDET